MKKVYFILFLVLISFSVSFGQTKETRTNYVRQKDMSSPEKTEETIQKMIAGHFNTVLVESPKILNSQGEVEYFGYSEKKDFEYFIGQAKNSGLYVEIWLYVARVHFTRPINGLHDSLKPEELDFREEEVIQKIDNWLSHLLENYHYYVDGVRMDYIRRYSAKKMLTIDSTLVPDESIMLGISNAVKTISNVCKSYDKYLTANLFSELPTKTSEEINRENEDYFHRIYVPFWFKSWYQQRSNTIYHLGSAYREVNKIDDIRLIPFFFKLGQNPVKWLYQGWVDKIYVMNHCHSSFYFERTIIYYKDMFNFTGVDIQKINMDIGYSVKIQDSKKIPTVFDHINTIRKHGLDGVSIFKLGADSLEDLDQDFITALTETGCDAEDGSEKFPPFFKEKADNAVRYELGIH